MIPTDIPMSVNNPVKCTNNDAIATIPKSVLSKNRVKIANWSRLTIFLHTELIVVSPTPLTILFAIITISSEIEENYNTFIIFKYSGHSPISCQDSSLTGKQPTRPPRAFTFSIKRVMWNSWPSGISLISSGLRI